MKRSNGVEPGWPRSSENLWKNVILIRYLGIEILTYLMQFFMTILMKLQELMWNFSIENKMQASNEMKPIYSCGWLLNLFISGRLIEHSSQRMICSWLKIVLVSPDSELKPHFRTKIELDFTEIAQETNLMSAHMMG